MPAAIASVTSITCGPSAAPSCPLKQTCPLKVSDAELICTHMSGLRVLPVGVTTICALR